MRHVYITLVGPHPDMPEPAVMVAVWEGTGAAARPVGTVRAALVEGWQLLRFRERLWGPGWGKK